jgi:hypothetical protein
MVEAWSRSVPCAQGDEEEMERRSWERPADSQAGSFARAAGR